MEPIIKRIECNVPCAIEFHTDGSVTIRSLDGHVPSMESRCQVAEPASDDISEPAEIDPVERAITREREATRQRVRRWREKQRSTNGRRDKNTTADNAERNDDVTPVTLGNAECNADVTPVTPRSAECNTLVTPKRRCCSLNKNKQQRQQEIDITWHIPEILEDPEFLAAWSAYCTWRNARGGAATLSRGGIRQRAESIFLQDLEEIANVFGVAAAVLTLQDTQNTGWVNRLHQPSPELLRECAAQKAQRDDSARKRELLDRCPETAINFLREIEKSSTIGVLRADQLTLSEITQAFAANYDAEEIEAWDTMWTPLHTSVSFLTAWDTLDEESQGRVLEKLQDVAHGGVVILTTDGEPVDGIAFCDAGQPCAVS